MEWYINSLLSLKSTLYTVLLGNQDKKNNLFIFMMSYSWRLNLSSLEHFIPTIGWNYRNIFHRYRDLYLLINTNSTSVPWKIFQQIWPHNQTCFPFRGQAEFCNLLSPQNPVTLNTNHVIVLLSILWLSLVAFGMKGRLRIKRLYLFSDPYPQIQYQMFLETPKKYIRQIPCHSRSN